MPYCVAGAVEDVEASIVEIVEGVETADLTAGELDFTQLAAFKVGV